jgi:hypothetical protein
MSDVLVRLCLPANLEMSLILGYAFLIFAGARLLELLARLHFGRARRYAEQGFHYDAEKDHYHCPQGERLSLHLVDPEERIAVYRAEASRCAGCVYKSVCTPHDEGRHIYRPLAEWAETDVGRFHQRLSLLMVASGSAIALIGLVWWPGQRGTGLLALAFLAGVVSIVRDVRWIWDSSKG